MAVSFVCIRSLVAIDMGVGGRLFCTFEPVSGVKILAGQNQSEQKHGEQTQGADQHCTQVHIWNRTRGKIHTGAHEIG